MAAHVVYLSDGTTSQYLQGSTSSNILIEYIPVGPAKWATPQDLESLDNLLTETLTFLLVDTTLSALRSQARTIELLLMQGERYAKTRTGAQTFIYWQPGGGSEQVYRSEICGGRLQLRKNSLSAGWYGLKMELELIITRRPYWEHDSATTIDGGTVYPCDDSAGNNYYDISSSSCVGDLPAPMSLSLTCTQASVTKAWLGHTAFATSAVHQLEGESATGASSQSDTHCSGDAYGQVSLTSTPTDVLSWALSNVSYYAGIYWRAIARFQTAPPVNTWFKLRLYDGSNLLWEMRDYRARSGALFQELGTLPIPPNGAGLSSLAALNLKLTAYNTDNTGTLKLDYLVLLPSEGLRYLDPAISISASDVLIDDGMTDALYISNSGGKHTGLAAFGERPMLWPGRTNRIYTVWGDDSANVDNWSGTLSISYRPRRATI